MRHVALIGLLCAGCESIFPLDYTGDAGDNGDGATDSTIDARVCSVREDFNAADVNPCGAAGSATANGMLERVGMELKMTPAPGGMNAVSCTTSAGNLDVVDLEVVSAPTQILMQTELRITDGNNSVGLHVKRDTQTGNPIRLELVVDGQIVHEAPYQAGPHRFWRLRVDQQGSVIAETSPDGNGAYLMFAPASTTLMPARVVVIETSVGFATNSPGNAVVDNFVACP